MPSPSPWRVLRKRRLTIEDVRDLVRYVPTYGYIDLAAFDLLLIRLYNQCRNETERRRVDRLANELLTAASSR